MADPKPHIHLDLTPEQIANICKTVLGYVPPDAHVEIKGDIRYKIRFA